MENWLPMMFKKLNSLRDVSVNVFRYKIDWDKKIEVSQPQKNVKKFLRSYWEHKMVCEEFRIPGSKLRLDIFCVSDGVVVEVSPAATHTMYNAFMHGSLSGYRDTIKRDLLKERWCAINGLTLVTLIDEDIANLSAELFLERFGVTL